MLKAAVTDDWERRARGTTTFFLLSNIPTSVVGEPVDIGEGERGVVVGVSRRRRKVRFGPP